MHSTCGRPERRVMNGKNLDNSDESGAKKREWETANVEAVEPAELLEAHIPADALADKHVEEYTQDANFAWVAAALTMRRDEILERWLDAAAQQPFHHGRKEHAVADHIPALFDALTGLLRTTTPRWVDAYAPLEDIGILSAAHSHSRARAEQGLRSADVVVEFRLLRQEIWRALRASIPNEAPTDDVVAAEILVNDALDGAITQGLTALNDQVEQLREEFLATTMHDVRQPLTAIFGEAQLLMRTLGKATPNLEKARTSAERIQTSVKRMMTLLETLTDMSKVALGSLDLRLSTVNLERVVRNAVAHCSPRDLARVTLTADPEADLTGEWDATRLEQVAANIIGNALKYSGAGTPVEIDLSSDEDRVTMRVQDHGIGIPPEDIVHVFSRYSRAHNAVESGVDGLGLGLYLCKGIVEAHGGRIGVASDGQDQGTTVTVVLPRR
jgi:signal transduction histidine kinase